MIFIQLYAADPANSPQKDVQTSNETKAVDNHEPT